MRVRPACRDSFQNATRIIAIRIITAFAEICAFVSQRGERKLRLVTDALK